MTSLSLSSQFSTTNSTPAKSVEEPHEEYEDKEEEHEEIHKKRRKNNGEGLVIRSQNESEESNKELFMSLNPSPDQPLSIEASLNSQPLSSRIPSQLNQLQLNEASSGAMEGEEEGSQEENVQVIEQEMRADSQPEPQERTLPLNSQLDPGLLETYLKDISFFNKHMETKAAVSCFRATLVPELEFLPGTQMSLFQWLSLYYPMLELENSLTSYHNMKIFKDVLQWSEYWCLKIQGSVIPKLDDSFFPAFSEHFAKFDIKDLYDAYFDIDSLKEEGLVTTKFETPVIKAFIQAFKKRELKFSSTYFALSSFKRHDNDKDGFEFYFARNSQDPVIPKYLLELPKSSYLKCCRNPDFAYNSPDNGVLYPDGKVSKFPHHEEHHFIFSKIIFYLCFLNFLKTYLQNKNKTILDEQDLYCVYFFDYRSSSNPLFWVSELLLNHFTCPIPNFSTYLSKEENPPFFLIKEVPGFSSESTRDFLKKLTNKILLYSPLFNQHLKTVSNIYKHSNNTDKERINQLRKKVSVLPQAFLEEVNNMENWAIPASRRQEILEEEARKKPDVNKLLTKPLSQQIIRNETTIQQASNFILELAQERSERGEIVANQFSQIIGKLNSVNSCKESVLNQQKKASEVFLNRRQTLANFLTNFKIKGESCEEEVDEVMLHPQCEEMLEALEFFFTHSFGWGFIMRWFEFILSGDDEDLDTKLKG